ncbi:unnamed protein product [Fusarium graminearum]|nr:unnamed protein product [Fusarium graminearum]
MHFYALIPAFITAVSAHGVVISVEGANGVSMPGLSIADGTPRDCSSNGCGSQADTAIIRDRELGTSEASALGRTQGNGPVDASVMIANFLGTSGSNNVPTNNGSDSGINQDGAGPMRADIDATSGGTDPDAFKSAEVTNDVPGVGFGGLSLATNTDFPLTVKMPQGMTCEGTVGGANNVCIVRVRNSAAAGPFGGSGAFTQSASARKRAIAFRLKKRMQIVRN